MNIIKAFFFSKGKFQPLYFWITMFSSLAFFMVLQKAVDIVNYSDTLLISILSFVISLIGLYNWKNNRGITDEEQKFGKG